ncbi:MAG: ion channel [Spirosomataceae bacterium]
MRIRKKTNPPATTEPQPDQDRPTRREQRRHRLVEQEERRIDIGFGKQITDPTTRLVNPDGSFNVRRVNNSFWGNANVYHKLITMSWSKFMLVTLILFLIANCLFAGIYYLIGMEHLQGIDMRNQMTQFWDAFFFSAQTLTTVGYGRIAPVGFWASFVASVESLTGLLSFAIATGLMYGRFSRPVAHILYSENMVVAPYADITGLMFRMVNERDNQLIDVEVEMMLSRLEPDEKGSRTRRYYAMPLERKKVNFFPISWTIVHPITETSPLYGLTLDDMKATDSEFMILIKATEDTFSQLVYDRTSYHAKEILWGQKFKIMYHSQGHTTTQLDLALLSETYPVPLPELAKQAELNETA